MEREKTRESGTTVVPRRRLFTRLTLRIPSQFTPRIRLEPEFAEEAVQALFSKADQADFRAYLEQSERIYETAPLDDRSTAFYRLHCDMFARMGGERLIAHGLKPFPELSRGLVEVVAGKPGHGRSEGADLRDRQDSGERVLFLSMAPTRLRAFEELLPWLHHELRHIADILDPAFGFARDDIAGNSPRMQRVRERYRTLWNVSVDGRLARKGMSTIATRRDRFLQLSQAFSHLAEPARRALFDSLWTTDLPTHQELVSLARMPDQAGPELDPVVRRGRCPLCLFFTFQWADQLPEDVTSRVEEDFPLWTPDGGICSRCAELYAYKARSRNHAA